MEKDFKLQKSLLFQHRNAPFRFSAAAVESAILIFCSHFKVETLQDLPFSFLFPPFKFNVAVFLSLLPQMQKLHITFYRDLSRKFCELVTHSL